MLTFTHHCVTLQSQECDTLNCPRRITPSTPPRVPKVKRARLHGESFCDWFSGPFRRPLGNLLQNRSEDQIALISPVIPERIFIQIGLQIFLGNLMINATNSAFNQGPQTVNRLRMNIASDVNFLTVINSLMRVSSLRKIVVSDPIICEHRGLRQDALFRNSQKVLLCRILRSESDCASLPFHDADNALLWRISRGTPTLPAALALRAKIAFVHLHAISLQLHIFSEKRPNLPEHTPCSLVSDAGFPLNLLCGNSAASGTHEVHRLKPDAQRRGAFLEDGSGQRIN